MQALTRNTFKESLIAMYAQKILIVLTLLIMNIACSQLKNVTPIKQPIALDIEQFFNGQLTAHGVVKNRSGEVIRSFNATINAHWKDNVGTLDEHFIFDDGETQTRIWTLTKIGLGKYKAKAGDVQGESLLNVIGNGLFMEYILRVPYKGRNLDLKVDDRMHLVDHNVLLNESLMYKWGFRVGAVNLVIIKQL